MQEFKDRGWDIDVFIRDTKKHPFVEGIYEITYGNPKLDRGKNVILGE